MNFESSLPYTLDRIRKAIFPPVRITPPPSNIIIEQDVSVSVRDKTKLSVNIYRPMDNLPHPVIISFHPYQKDKLPQKYFFGYRPLEAYSIMRQPSPITISALTSWEAPDPAFWVSKGYVVINADVRGFGKSGGVANLLSDQEAEDYYDLIEWAGVQRWSNGNVGLSGVSYLAISQYKVAALNPPHLKAICPWEGFSDLYEDLVRPGGIREDGFFPLWSKALKINFREKQCEHQLRDEWYQSLCPDLSKITVPALICASFSDQSLHTKGSFRFFNKISSQHKWLYTHRDGKWAVYYSDEALGFQVKFFNYFLKKEKNDILSMPPVRLEVRESRDKISEISYQPTWPIPNIHWKEFYLNAQTHKLQFNKVARKKTASFFSQSGGCQFEWETPQDVKIIGPMKLHLFIELEGCNDISLFIAIRKFKDGVHIPFEGSFGCGLDVVSKGWLKASLRNIDKNKSTSWSPHYTFDREEFLHLNQIVSLEIALLPSATLFRKGEVLRLDIQGHPILKRSLLQSQPSTYEPNLPGNCFVHCGKEYDSHLLVPIVYM